MIRTISRIHFAIASVSLAVFGLAAGCSDSTQPNSPSEQAVQSSFAAQMTSGTYPPAAPTVQTTTTSILVSGVIATPTPCYKVSALTSAAHDTLVVQITGTTGTTDVCAESIAFWHYTVTVAPRPSGLSMIRVLQASGSGQPSVVLQQPLGTS